MRGRWAYCHDSENSGVTHDAALLAADERARKDALDVTRSFIVQAPAGFADSG